MSLRVFVGLDGSPCSNAAVAVALDIARRRPDVELTALHVVNVVAPSGNMLKDLPGRLGFEPAVVAEDTARRHDEAGRELLSQAKAAGEAVGIAVRTVLDHGAVGERLQHHAAHADLLVLGVAGETDERFPGQGRAMAYRVVADGACPTLLVQKDQTSMGGVALGYDGSPAAARTVALIRMLGPDVAKPVHAIYVSRGGEGPPVPLERVVNELDGFSVETHLVSADAVANGLSQAAADVGCHTLAVGFSGRSQLHDFVFGRSVELLVGQSELNLLVAH